MLTHAAVKAARPRAAAYKLADQRGLHLFVTPGGRKSFRWRFRIDGREQLLTIGSWPEVALDQARAAADFARAALARGEDPRTGAGTQVRGPATFEEIGRRWYAHTHSRWSAKHAADVIGSLERDVFPALGTMPIGGITAPVVLAVLRQVEGRSRIETARRIRQRISAVFAFAMSEGLIDQDPAAIVGKALQPSPPSQSHPALLDSDDVRALLAAVDQLDAAPAAVAASRFLALTAVRLDAVRGARWSEIEELDGPAPLWRVPAARMKLKKAQKGSAANDHLVPLSPAAVTVLRAARANSHSHDANMQSTYSVIPDLIFPGRSVDRPIGEAAIGTLYTRAGYAGRHVPHGWRASFSTIMNEAFPAERVAIDRALAHAPKDKVEAVYNRSEQLAARRQLFEAWGKMIMPACRGDDVGD